MKPRLRQFDRHDHFEVITGGVNEAHGRVAYPCNDTNTSGHHKKGKL